MINNASSLSASVILFIIKCKLSFKTRERYICTIILNQHYTALFQGFNQIRKYLSGFYCKTIMSCIHGENTLGFNKTPRKNGRTYFSPANSVIYDRVTQKHDDVLISFEQRETKTPLS